MRQTQREKSSPAVLFCRREPNKETNNRPTGSADDRVFVQGDNQNDLIPAVAEMAKQLRQAILTWNPALLRALTTSAASKEPVSSADVTFALAVIPVTPFTSLSAVLNEVTHPPQEL